MSRATIPAPSALMLAARTAEELMTPNPVSLREDAAIPEAVTLMANRGFGAAPVIDEAGHPVGVLSHSDILVHNHEKVRHAQPAPELKEEAHPRQSRLEGLSIEIADSTRVRDLMTPAVFTISMTTSSADVVKRMCELKVHQLLVVDADNVLVGVITALDIVRQLTHAT